MSIERTLLPSITTDLNKKMVLLDGPRQIGKTTLAKQILGTHATGVYLSWDRREDRSILREARWPAGPAIVVLDELHKCRGWKRWIKGEYDRHGDRLQFLVTGSARLDIYRRGGDSLQGRYHHYRLHPFSCAELEGNVPDIEPRTELDIPASGASETLDALMRFGGFPEPYVAQSDRATRRWRKDRLDRFFREDVRDLESVRELSSIQDLAEMIGERVASPLSLNSLREDLEVSHRAVSHWLQILMRLYFAFDVRPFTSTKVRALRKMPKVYLWDAGLVSEDGPRFENLVALHLLKFCHFLEDTEGHRVQLHYLRDSVGREVDFLVTADNRPWLAVECKVSDQALDPSLTYFKSRLGIPWAYQIAWRGERDYLKEGVRCLPAHRFLRALA